MKDEMPLTDRDFADIRTSVMRTIEVRRTRTTQLAFAAIALVIASSWPSRMGLVDERTPAPAPPRIARLDAGEGAGAPLRTVSTPRRHRHHKRAKQRAPQVAVARDTTPIRLELETADPDIRIIWITGETR